MTGIDGTDGPGHRFETKKQGDHWVQRKGHFVSFQLLCNSPCFHNIVLKYYLFLLGF